MKTKTVLCLFALILLSRVTFADDDVGQVARGTAKTFIISYGEQEVKSIADKKIAEEIGAKSTDKIGGAVATDLMAAYEFYQATKDFGEAKEDSQRFYASMSAASAVVSVCFPPAGMVATLVTLAAELFGSAVQSAYAEDIMRIQKETSDIIAKTAATQQEIVKSELNYVNTIYPTMMNYYKLIGPVEKRQKEHCSSVDKIKNFDDLNYCLATIYAKRKILQTILYLGESLKNFRGSYVTYDDFKKSFKTNEDFPAFLGNIQGLLGIIDSTLDKQKKIFVRYVTELNNANIEASADYRNEVLINECKTLRFEQTAWLIKMQESVDETLQNKDTIGFMELRAKLKRSINSYNETLNEMCSGLPAGDAVNQILDGIVRQLGAT